MPSVSNNSALKQWTIYKITSPTGRIYIGKTCNYTARRRQYSRVQLKRQDLIMNSIVKHGWGAHIMEAIDTFSGTATESCSKEIFWIRSYMSNKCKYPEQNGLNMTDGGEGVLGIKRSEEYKQKCRDRNVGKKLTEEHKKNIGDSLRGRLGSNKGYRHTKEWKKSASQRLLGNQHNKGKIQSIETIQKRVAKLKGRKYGSDELLMAKQRAIKSLGIPIIVFNRMGVVVGEYKTQVECSLDFGMNQNTVLRRLKLGENKTKKGEYDPLNEYIFTYQRNQPCL